LAGRGGGRSAAASGAGRACHLVGLTNAAVIIMGVVLGAMVIVLMLVLVSHH
jgi:hypothetical protein